MQQTAFASVFGMKRRTHREVLGASNGSTAKTKKHNKFEAATHQLLCGSQVAATGWRLLASCACSRPTIGRVSKNLQKEAAQPACQCTPQKVSGSAMCTLCREDYTSSNKGTCNDERRTRHSHYSNLGIPLIALSYVWSACNLQSCLEPNKSHLKLNAIFRNLTCCKKKAEHRQPGNLQDGCSLSLSTGVLWKALADRQYLERNWNLWNPQPSMTGPRQEIMLPPTRMKHKFQTQIEVALICCYPACPFRPPHYPHRFPDNPRLKFARSIGFQAPPPQMISP